MRRREHIWRLRAAQQRQLVARLLFQGVPTKKIATRLHMSAKSTRDLMNTAEFQEVYQAYEREQLAVIDRAMPKLLLGALTALARLLRHRDATIRHRAVEMIVEHTQILERLAGRYGPPRSGGAPSDPNPVGEMPLSDEQRDLHRRLMRSIRSAQPQPGTPSAIVSRITGINGPNQN